MGSRTEFDMKNIIVPTVEDHDAEEHRKYLEAQEQFKAQYMMGFKKDRQGKLTKAPEFVVPALKVSNDKIEVISKVGDSIPESVTSTPDSEGKRVDERFSMLMERMEKLEKEKSSGNSDSVAKTEIPHIRQHEVIRSSPSAAPRVIPDHIQYGMPVNYRQDQSTPGYPPMPTTAGSFGPTYAVS